MTTTTTAERFTVDLHVTTGPDPDDFLTLASPPADLALLADGRTGPAAALKVLREAVLAGNVMAGELARYAASLPLSPAAVEDYLRLHNRIAVQRVHEYPPTEGCTCCQVKTRAGHPANGECSECGHLNRRHANYSGA